MNSRNVAFAVREALRESGVELGFNHLQIIKEIIDGYIAEDEADRQSAQWTALDDRAVEVKDDEERKLR